MKPNNMTTPSIRNSLSRPLLRRGFLLIPLVFALTWFALSPTVRAVDPPPDGGYANFNTAEGDGTLNLLYIGAQNTAIGANALNHNDGNANTAVGAFALDINTVGNYNTASGVDALACNQGSYNTGHWCKCARWHVRSRESR